MRKLLATACTLAVAACGTVLFQPAALAAGQSQPDQNLLFILDASGSMWGRIGGTPKISVAKQVMSKLVKDLPDNVRAGLTAYGHRRKGDCTDIESLVGLEPLDRDAMIERIEALNPKGKTPITAAVKQAIDQLRQVEESASVVLVSDGLESCGGDPCEAVKAAKKSGVDFTLHVVGFDLGDTDTGQLQCMADAGGGQFFTAANADELAGALDEVVQAKPGLVLDVTRNGKPFVNAFTYVYKAGTDDEVARHHIGQDGQTSYTLSPGDYDIRIRPHGISAPDRRLEGITVTYGETTRKSVDFSPGTVELTVTTNGKPLKARTYIQDAEDHKEAGRDGTDDEGIARYTVPVGEYRIKVRPDGISAPDQYVDNVVVNAGETTEKSLDFGSGTARVTVTTNGKPLKARTYIQHADSHKEAARDGTDSDGVASYTIPVGEYRIKVRPDGISAPDQYVDNVVVKAGETTEKRLDFGSGTAQVTVTTNGKPLQARTYIEHADDHKQAASGRTDDEGIARTIIPVGEYRIKVRPDGISAPIQYVDNVTVKAGETTEKSLDIPSGTAQVTVTSNGEPVKARIYIQHADSHKQAASDRTDDEGVARTTIPVGKYRIKVRPDSIKADPRYLEEVMVRPAEITEASLDFASDASRDGS